MYRTKPTIDLEDKVVMREAAVRRDPIIHETPQQFASETL